MPSSRCGGTGSAARAARSSSSRSREPVTRESVPSATVTRDSSLPSTSAQTSAVSAEEKRVRRGTPDQAGARARHAPPAVLVDRHAVDDHGVRLQAAERLEPRQLSARLVVDAFGEVDEERRVARRRPPARRDVAARLAAGAGRTRLEQERMRPAVAPDHANRHRAAQLRIERVVMRDRRHAGEQVLEPADEQPLDQRVGASCANRRIGRDSRGPMSAIQPEAFS